MLNSIYNKYSVHLIQNVSELSVIKPLLNEKVNVGCDSETTGLDYNKDEVVGVCISCGHGYSPEQYHGFYIPIRHINYKDNLPVKEVIELVQFIVDNYKTCWWNRNYDFTMLEKDGFVAPFTGKTHDVQVMAHLVNQEPFPALKETAANILKFDVIEFSANNAKDHNFGCFTPDVEFLTSEGFKRFDDITNEEVAQWDSENGITFIKPISRIDTVGKVVSYTGKVDFSVSEEHRVLTKDGVILAKDLPTKVQIPCRSFIKDTPVTEYFFKRTTAEYHRWDGAVFTRYYGTSLGMDSITMCELIGLLLSDGSLDIDGSRHEFVISQSLKPCKDKQRTYIENVFSKLNGHWTTRVKKKNMQCWSITNHEFCKWIQENCYKDGVKRVPDFLFRLGKNHLNAFIKAFYIGDGSNYSEKTGKFHMDVYSSKELANDISSIAFMAGYSVRVSTLFNDNTGKVIAGRELSPKKSIGYRIHCSLLEYRTTKFKNTTDSLTRVVCFSVPSTFLVVKQNGVVFISGNSTDPTITFRYASQDPLATTLLARKIWADYPYIRKIYPIDNKSAEAIRKFSLTTDLYLNKELLGKFKDENNAELAKVKQEIFSLVGYQFKLNSNKDKADALNRVVTLTKKTKSGQFDVSKEVLSEIDHPLAKLLVRYATLEKFRSSYLEKMYEFPNPFKVNYHSIDVPTGRLASGASKGNSYFAPINIQNIPKVEVYKYLHKGGVLGYYLDYNKDGAIGKLKCKGGLRDCFISPEGYVWISADYSAQEVRVLAILSNEQVLIDPILHGEDIHKFVATKMFGHYDPSHRTIAKTITFSANYGGSGYTIAKRLGISQQEGDELLNRYNKTLANATRWKQETQKDARRKGIVFTYFGRPRCVWKYYNSSDRGLQAFGDRTAINSPIQGFGGDLIRIDHIKLWQKFIDDKEFADNVKYACTVHDEINLFVKPHYLKKAMTILTGIMNFQPESFPIPISVSPSAGFGWGDQIEADITDDNKISLPDYDNIPEAELIAKFKSENPELYQ